MVIVSANGAPWRDVRSRDSREFEDKHFKYNFHKYLKSISLAGRGFTNVEIHCHHPLNVI